MLALLKFLPFLAKLGALSKWFAFIPGGQIVAIVGAVFGLVVKFVGWLLADIMDAFKEPQRLVVRVLCGLVILGVGVHQGIKWSEGKVHAARAEVAAIKADLRQKDQDDAKLAAAAKAAREEAAHKALAAPAAVAPVVADPAAVPGVQPKRAGKPKHKEPGVLDGFPALPWTSK